jgi:methylase of polypeptide subunit release factors
MPSTSANFQALVQLGRTLQSEGYRFTTVTPTTHARVSVRRHSKWASDLRDVFGWNKPFQHSAAKGPIPEPLFALMQRADILVQQEDGWKSTVRAATLDGQLFFHSAFPTSDKESVFLGPDTYRFVRLLDSELAKMSTAVSRAIDIGCGAGPGAIAIAARCPHAEVFAIDINEMALRLTEVNIALAGLHNVTSRNSDMMTAVEGNFDLIVSNPPYLLDGDERVYRHGGGPLGAGLSAAIVKSALDRLTIGGTLLLYTGSVIVDGQDLFKVQIENILSGRSCEWSYDEIDPDVFGEELEQPFYMDAERIAVVWLKVRRTN